MPTNKANRKMHRTTVDLPLIMHKQMRWAAWQETQASNEIWTGMYRRYIEGAVRQRLEREGYWPVTELNVSPPTGLEVLEARARERRAAQDRLPHEYADDNPRDPAPDQDAAGDEREDVV